MHAYVHSCALHSFFTARPPALSVNVTKNIETLSIVVQWDAVDDSLPTTYTVTWTSSERDGIQVATLIEQTSYTITAITVSAVYTITVTAANVYCGSGPEFSTTILFCSDTTDTKVLAIGEIFIDLLHSTKHY